MVNTTTLPYSETKIFADLFESFPTAMILISQDYQIRAINRQAFEMIQLLLNYELKVDESLLSLATIFKFADFEEHFNEALRGKLFTEEQAYTYKESHAPEQCVEFTYSPIKAHSGEVVAVCLSFANISERKKIEALLVSSMSTNQTLLDVMPDMLFRISRDGVFVNSKSGSEEKFLTHRENFIGKRVSEVLPPAVAEKTLSYVEKALQTGELQVFEYQLELNGSRSFFEARLVVSAEDEVMAIVRDITERCLAEESLQYRLQFEALVASISTNFANVSTKEIDSEINQALAAIGRFSRVDCAFILLFSEDSTQMNLSYEWGENGISSHMQLLQNLPLASFPWIEGQIRQFGNLNLPNFDLIPDEAHYEREALENQEVQSLLMVPLVFEKKPLGFLGFEAVKTKKTWSSEDIDLLKVLGEIFTSSIKRKITEQLLIEERNFAQLVVNTMGEGLAILNPEGDFQFVNPVYAKMVGYSLEEIIGKNPAEFIHPEDRHLQADAFSRRSIGEISTYENRIIHHNGSTLYVSVTGVPLFRENQFKGVIAVINNITARKQVEEALSQSERRLQTVVSNIPMMLIAVNQNGVITVAEGQGFKELGIDSTKLIGHSIEAPSNVTDTYIANKLRQAMEGEVVKAIIPIKDKAYEFSLTPIKEEAASRGKQVFGVIGVALDVSERLQAEKEMRRALEKEKELNIIKSNFISMASHDFRTPLTAIYSSAELLENHGHRWDDERKQKIYQRIYTSVKSITELLDEVLYITKSEAGKLEFNPAPLDLTEFCVGLIEEIQLDSSIAEYYFDLTFPPTPKQVWADQKLLRKILANLLTNAVKYSPPGSTVHFELAYREEEVVIIIKDEGIGIPEEGLNHLYEVFYRATNVANIKGTGLGLVIVKKSLEAHSGKIEIESKVGSGTCCTVTIPLVQDQDRKASLHKFPVGPHPKAGL